jgi:hypothetical protein
MSNFTAIIPVDMMDAANAKLEKAGFGPKNFSCPVATEASGSATHALLHCWHNPTFRQALIDLAIPELKIVDGTGEPNADAVLNDEGLEWIRPEGSHDTYAKGQRVSVNGKTWESLIDFNAWPPGISGWREIVAKGNSMSDNN